MRREDKAPRFLNLGTRGRGVVIFALQQLCPRGRGWLYPLGRQEARHASDPVWYTWISLPCRPPFALHAVSSKSLVWKQYALMKLWIPQMTVVGNLMFRSISWTMWDIVHSADGTGVAMLRKMFRRCNVFRFICCDYCKERKENE
jgi:hypothetical protein